MKGRVLIIAGSDPSGGAGIQADIKTVTALGGYAMTAITALTVQNTLGVQQVFPIPDDIIRGQISACLDDIGADCVKIGMIADPKVIAAIAELVPADIPMVMDPVLVATIGDRLAGDDVSEALKTVLFPRAAIATPNVPELGTLSGLTVNDSATLKAAGRRLLKDTQVPVLLLKGGHLAGDRVTDWLMSDSIEIAFSHPRLDTRSTHGTGCTLASAIAAALARGASTEQAVRRAGDYVHRAIATAPGFGKGCGPLNHAHPLER